MINGGFAENIVLVLSTCTLALLGITPYTTNRISFRLKKNRMPLTKETATIVYVLSIYFLAVVGGFIENTWKEQIGNMPDLSMLGVTLIVSRFAINNLVPNWRQDDKKSIQLHILGVLLIIVGYIFDINFF